MIEVKKGDEKSEEKKYSLFEQIIFILDEEKCEELNTDAISSLSALFPSDLEKKKRIN